MTDIRQYGEISIHAPHAGCDHHPGDGQDAYLSISIHAPHAGCDSDRSAHGYRLLRFQSTHPMRGATATWPPGGYRPSNFNPRTPCGVRPDVPLFDIPKPGDFNPRTPCGVRLIRQSSAFPTNGISIHAPHAGCDSGRCKRWNVKRLFQSTHPMRGATEEPAITIRKNTNFNPRTPCGVRLVQEVTAAAGQLFQSTHPMRGATSSPSILLYH